MNERLRKEVIELLKKINHLRIEQIKILECQSLGLDPETIDGDYAEALHYFNKNHPEDLIDRKFFNEEK